MEVVRNSVYGEIVGTVEVPYCEKSFGGLGLAGS